MQGIKSYPNDSRRKNLQILSESAKTQDMIQKFRKIRRKTSRFGFESCGPRM